jgi:hypothetical protein
VAPGVVIAGAGSPEATGVAAGEEGSSEPPSSPPLARPIRSAATNATTATAARAIHSRRFPTGDWPAVPAEVSPDMG